jgi:NADPH:quinone reductase-like Zn-dependent oxidoreductase
MVFFANALSLFYNWTLPTTMRALRQTSLYGPQDLRLITDAPVPSPGSGEVLIRVTAAGVNFVDPAQRERALTGLLADGLAVTTPGGYTLPH